MDDGAVRLRFARVGTRLLTAFFSHFHMYGTPRADASPRTAPAQDDPEIAPDRPWHPAARGRCARSRVLGRVARVDRAQRLARRRGRRGRPDDEQTSPFVEALVGPLDPSVPPFRPGDVIANKYQVEEILGCGGMAWVLRATHLQLNQKVALKFLRFAATRDAVARFFQEGRAAARVSSEAVTRISTSTRCPTGRRFS